MQLIWPSSAWGVLIVVAHFDCPLTWLECWARARVAHYITGVFYPAGRTDAIELTVLTLVMLSWLLYVRQRLRRNISAPRVGR